jgi:tRNA (adenine22-N1)-methyltransferase
MMKLSPRLAAVASFVRKNAAIADVGSDHAELPLYLFEEGRIAFCQAIENKAGPYERSAEALLSSRYQSRILLSLSDGISHLDPQVDTVVIAGMGGALVSSILTKHPERLAFVTTIIVDPHTDWPLVRKTLMGLSFVLSEEKFLYDERIAYDVMKWEKSSHPIVYSERELFFGPLALAAKPSAWKDYWGKEKARLEALAASSLPATKKCDVIALIKEIAEVISA